MKTQTMVLFYVNDCAKSQALYQALLARPAAQHSTDFAMFALDGGSFVALKSRQSVLPETLPAAGAAELVLLVGDISDVNRSFEHWRELGLRITQQPQAMPFGYTFVAEDFDGHLLRVCCPAK
ncbi:VOC family protein [Gallaecimonas pentaromativorans]|uniref:Putative lactoylglutathione lyase n=1 Tax=Gallaecimonas pentaromativorans TaxID=584787 RepID=A0A3N1PBH3_9GAMM|nr:VOC family protein [Gallaecimonas pentaromativorans]ROQ25913.1 putative lactoylglutathione lyase [Gallaecimonas pentaromativorans]